MTDCLSAIRTALAGIPVDVRLYDSLDSTNTEVKRNAATITNPTLYLTRTQTAGRGRLGRSFHSPADTGLYMTLALPTERPLCEVVQITALAAIAATAAIQALTDKRPSIKWVNDLYMDGRKLAGILTEAVAIPETSRTCLIVGIGLNLTTAAFPPELADTATSLFLPSEADRVTPTWIGTLAGNITRRLCGFMDAPSSATVGGESCLSFYRRHLCFVGEAVVCTRGSEIIPGILRGVDDDYSLLLDTPNGPLTLASGEITLRRAT